jgi:hypothetical protein
MSEWDGFDTEQPAPAPPAPAPPATPPTAAATSTAPTMDPAEQAAARIKAIWADKAHGFHHGDAEAQAEMQRLYQQLYGPSRDPGVAASDDDLGGWTPEAAEVVAELRELCAREGHLPQFQGHEMTTPEFDTLVERCCEATGDGAETAWLVSRIGAALWGGGELDLASEQVRLRAEWGEQFEAKVAVAAGAVAAVFPDSPGEAGRFVAQHPRLMRLAIEWTERRGRR